MSSVTPAPFEPSLIYSSTSEGIEGIPAVSEWVLPAGIYVLPLLAVGVDYYFYYDSAWVLMNDNAERFFFSNGANVKLFNTYAGTRNINWVKYL